MAMFGEYLFNITNTSLNNITVEADSPAEFASRRDPEGRRGLQADEYVDYRDGIPYTENFPLADDIDWRNNFNLPELYPDRLVDDPLTPAESQNLYNTIDCSLDEREELRLDGGSSIHPNILIRLSMTFLSATDRGAHACLTLSTQNAMRHFLAAFGMTPCRDRSYICRPALEIIPAPSPPPPDNWVIPPSPPAFAYETLTLATATGSSALFFVISAVCCIGIGGRYTRARHNSRMIGTRDQRVDRMPYLPEEYERRGQEPTGPFRPDLQQPGARLVTSSFSFSGLTTRHYNQVTNQERL